MSILNLCKVLMMCVCSHRWGVSVVHRSSYIRWSCVEYIHSRGKHCLNTEVLSHNTHIKIPKPAFLRNISYRKRASAPAEKPLKRYYLPPPNTVKHECVFSSLESYSGLCKKTHLFILHLFCENKTHLFYLWYGYPCAF